MDKKYIFVNDILKKTPIYEMPEEDFLRISEANKTVFEVYRFEEMFAMLIDNFYAFNNVIFTYADRARLQFFSPSNYFQKSIDVNRAALNFMATLSMYQDFVCERIGAKEIIATFSQSKEIQRCMVMRNYIQHVESFPVIANTSSSLCDLDVTLSSVRFRVAANKLKADRLHKGTRKDFTTFFDMDEQIDLYEIINRGMGEIQLIQKQIRKLPLYEKYSQSKAFLLDIEKKIAPHGISSIKPCYYYESDDDQNWKTCFVAMDTIKFIDENINHYTCMFSIANQFITTAPPEFVKKCSDKILSPALKQKTLEQTQIDAQKR